MPGAPAALVNMSMITAKPHSMQAATSDSPSDSQPQNALLAPSSSIQPFAQPTVSSALSTSDGADLWKQAYDMIRKQEPKLIEDYDKYVLGDATSSADLSNREAVKIALKKLLEGREKKQWKIPFLGHDIKIRTQVEKLTKFLQWSDPFVKDAVSTQPYAALAWSGVSLLLPLLTSSTTQNEAMLKGFNSISDLQMYWKIVEETYLQSEHRQHYQRLIKPLVELYSHAFAYQAYVICHLSKSQHSRAWKNLTSPNFWTNELEDIDKIRKKCYELIEPSREKEIQENRDSQLQESKKLRITQEDLLQSNKEDKRDEEETRLLHDLAEAAGDYKSDKNLNPRKVPGTCEWFLTDERFSKWRDSQSPSLLWVSAGPGCGKSVLAKSLIDGRQLATCATTITFTPSSIDAATSEEPTVCYFFFKDGGGDDMDSARALCAILHQLFISPSTSGLIKHALKSHREHGQTLTRKFLELWRILSDCVTSSDTGEIICVLDALDECKENSGEKNSRQEFIKTLQDFYSQSEKPSTASSKLKFLVTSRPYSDLERSFEKFRTTAAYLRFDGDEKSEQIRQEIDLVIDAKVRYITDGFTPEDQQKISERLKSMDNRTYLWLHLTLNIIEKSPSKFGRRYDIEKLLSHLPTQVSDAYEEILSRSTDQIWTETLLRIMLAAARPLTLDEANVALALAIEDQEPTLHSEFKSNMWPINTFRSIVTNLCGLFVSVYESKLSFIHLTAREFLTDYKKKGKWQGRFNMRQSHGTISRSCLLYLLLPDIKRPLNDDLVQDKQYPYLAYAATYWPLHFDSQDVTNANAFRKHARTLCKVSEHQASIWAPSYLEQESLSWEGCTDLILASYLGFNVVVEDILSEKPAVGTDAKDEYGRTALYWASGYGHVEVVKLLLEKGADPAIVDNDGETPLYWVSREGHVEVVKLLLENGADPTAANNYENTPLNQASIEGHVEIVKLLLEKGADPAVATWYRMVPLHLASSHGHVEVIKLLLEKGADLEATNNDGETPLYRALNNGQFEVVKLLLENGADPKVANSNGVTPLYWAVESVNIEVIKLLLKKGANLAAADNDGGTPFYWAVENGNVEVIKLLLENGADLTAADSYGETPLYWAVENGNVEVIKLLLENGADPTAADSHGRTPLHRAVENWNFEVLELLSVFENSHVKMVK